MSPSLATLRAAPKIKMHWGGLDNIYPGGGFGLPGNGPWTSGSTYLPFDAHATAAGESPTSYSFYGRTYSALTADCVLTKFEVGGSTSSARAHLYDLLWLTTNYAAIGTQTINSNPLPARDVLGGINGVGCALAVFVGGNGTYTVSYTNSDGVAGRTASVTTNGIQSGPIWLNLDTGDSGVKSIQSVTCDSASPYRVAVIRTLAFSRMASGGGIGAPSPTPDQTSRLGVITPIYSGAMLFSAWTNAGGIGARQFSTDIELAVV